MKLILLGAPGAGKGTQAAVICRKFMIPAISTGNIIREEMKNATELGEKAKSYVDAGGLVPDDLVIDMLKKRISQEDCINGFILDGYPRTIPQAQALERMGIIIDKVIDIEVEDEEIVERLAGRRMCSACGTTFHIKYNPSKEEYICDSCQGSLSIRADDNPETVRERLSVYHEQTEPLKEFYEKRGKLSIVKGQEMVEDTTRLVLEAVEAE